MHKGCSCNLKHHALNLLTHIRTSKENIVVSSISRYVGLVKINYWVPTEEVSTGIYGEDGRPAGIAWCWVTKHHL